MVSSCFELQGLQELHGSYEDGSVSCVCFVLSFLLCASLLLCCFLSFASFLPFYLSFSLARSLALSLPLSLSLFTVGMGYVCVGASCIPVVSSQVCLFTSTFSPCFPVSLYPSLNLPGWFLVGNEEMGYPMCPYIYPLREYVGYLVPPFPTKKQVNRSVGQTAYVASAWLRSSECSRKPKP